ncbi:hypothetical protein GCM10025868_06980 [Angustibacter aerolatus]|uniref:Helicase ATP-binding domain-containing protein n=1 Tax=Angustibacter aerolatus TaxID=1162965 RepID=A0ABQ6JBA1_9ACTN|nr:hypothetical protein GCM10025868_06980 [Angustibacter aerolatus]
MTATSLVPGVSERAWRQVSVSAHECLGSKCPVFDECFVEQARSAARESDVVVTNHSILAIDAFEGRAILPEHDLVVVDEAHEPGRPGHLHDHRRAHRFGGRARRPAQARRSPTQTRSTARARRCAAPSSLVQPGRLATLPPQPGPGAHPGARRRPHPADRA